ncbi:hypothetical protein HYH03_016444 [Edaphochlamys debaryana]|uniref:GCK domain-containing protein n=1 Tax=Edaphochlamys debaryana TaxID=47281 RepID=A0A835XM87_9CHLO|nr:hypothetical protein HYH03_016444 [Edaphochlamys debaryana]|eukprot:KAG2484791.1 hypothetical protein HYH03_016444 [Edaphochlamys debaryana]
MPAAESEAARPSNDDSPQRPQPAEPATAEPAQARSQEGEEGEEGPYGGDPSRCPICQFIEAGACKEAHQDWVACRDEAKAAGKDYIDECQDRFKSFLQCAIDNRDYYEPFLEMLGGLPEPGERGEGGEAGEAEGAELAKDGEERAAQMEEVQEAGQAAVGTDGKAG